MGCLAWVCWGSFLTANLQLIQKIHKHAAQYIITVSFSQSFINRFQPACLRQCFVVHQAGFYTLYFCLAYMQHLLQGQFPMTDQLAGMVVGLKDLLCYKDHPVQAASKILEGFVSQFSATAVQRLANAGAIIMILKGEVRRPCVPI